MDAFVALVEENPLAVAFGALGLYCQLIWPLFRARRAIMTAQFGIGADYSAHYALMDAWSGAGVAAIGATQTAVTIIAGDRPWLRWMGLVFLPIVVVICAGTMGYLDKVPVNQISRFERGLLAHVRSKHADLLNWITKDDPKIKGEAETRIRAVLTEFAADFA